MPELELDEEIERRAAAAVGTVLDRKWRLDRLLGCGGMGAVYAATHRNGTRAAIKILHPEAALSPALRRRFLREGYVANKVEHPGAVSILDDDIDASGNAYLVMQLLNGETLDARLNRFGGRLPVEEVLQIASSILDCLEAAHARGIVHRDIKPGNLFLTTEGQVKVLDFGIARLSESRGKRGDTTGMQALGTPDFMPPEQARGHWDQVDGRSDIFAVGAVMLYALTGRPLREAPTTNEQLLMAMTEPLPSLGALLPDASDMVVKLVDRALAFRKEDRFADAASFRQAARATYGSIAAQPIERAPALSVRAVPNGPVSTPTSEAPERPFGMPEEALISMPASSLPARSPGPTKIIVARPGARLLRVSVVAVTLAGALFAMTYRVALWPRIDDVAKAKSAAAGTLAPIAPRLAPTEPEAPLTPPAVSTEQKVPASDVALPNSTNSGEASPRLTTEDTPVRHGVHMGKRMAVVALAPSSAPPSAASPAAPGDEAGAAPLKPSASEGPSEAPHAVDLFSRRK
ncbi:MAG TPA: protein kinase [Polyangiaceae bacterium]|nr:protein kinase [Polyangiaceae bacterium]